VTLRASGAAAEPFPDNRYAVDLFQGPILAPIRVTGISGSYAGYAEGIEGMVSNAAAPAVREPFSANWLEVDVAGSVSIPLSIFENNDFDNSNAIDSDYSNFIYLTGGALLQAGMFGVGANLELHRYTLTGSQGEATHVTVGKHHVLGAVRLFGDQLVLGAGPRIVTLGLDAPEASLTLAGVAPEFGILVRPDWKSFRIGATYRMPVDAGGLIGDVETIDEQGRRRAGDLILPERVVLPWEIEVGVAIQVGPRPLNPEWINPRDQEAELAAQLRHRRAARSEARSYEIERVANPAARAARARELAAEEARLVAEEDARFEAAKDRLTRERRARYWNWPRHHLLFTAEVLISGQVDRAVSLAEFLGQNEPSAACREVPAADRAACERARPPLPGISGRAVNWSPRFGIETEPVPSLVKTRFGSYYEPNRLSDGRIGRQHFTFGADLRVLSTTWWGLVPEVIYKLQASFDIAPRYESFSFGVGVWH
jgi:hypothetical protein